VKYYWDDKVKKEEMGGAYKHAYKKFIWNFSQKRDDKRPLGAYMPRWEDNIKTDLKKL
jgi:hypothetical protein